MKESLRYYKLGAAEASYPQAECWLARLTKRGIEPVHYIFEVKMKPGYPPERYAEGWVEASTIIQQSPGARGTRLHRKIGEPDVLLAIATWESKAARDEMEGEPDPGVQAIISQQAEHVEFRFIGEYEDPEWEVIPPHES